MTTTGSGIWANPIKLETKVSRIISDQAYHGVNFNARKAKWGVHLLKERIINIDKELVPQLPAMMHTGTTYKKPFLMSGKPAAFVKKYCANMGLPVEYIGGPFSAVHFTPFDPGKVQRLKYVMFDNGWVPAVWNQKKNPLNEIKHLPQQVQQDMLHGYIMKTILGHGDAHKEQILKSLGYGKRKRTLGELRDFVAKAPYWPTSPKISPDEDQFVGDSHLLELIRLRMVWSHRKSLIEGLISNVRKDGKLSGEAMSCATPTARMRHRIVVNIPAARAPFGAYCRSLFIGDRDPSVKARVDTATLKKNERVKRWTNRIEEWDEKKGKWKDGHTYKMFFKEGQQHFVGYDGSGLELRMLAHYVGDDEYTKQILEGDIHTHNQNLAGLPTRDAAKTFIYAFNYGAGDGKLGTLVNGGAKEGAAIRARFLKENPKLKKLIDRIQEEGKNGYVIGIDGRKLWLRKGFGGEYQTHKALNVLLQGAGAIVMKYAMCILDNDVKRLKLRANKVLDVHDEGQWTCHPDDVPSLRECMNTCLTRAGVMLKLNCPLASESILGRSWFETH